MAGRYFLRPLRPRNTRTPAMAVCYVRHRICRRAGAGGRPGYRAAAWQAGGVIVGIGVDLVDIARLERALRRTPALAARLFAEGERGAPAASLAACFAAKEAVAKALGRRGDRARPGGPARAGGAGYRGRRRAPAGRAPVARVADPRWRGQRGVCGGRGMRNAHTVADIRAAEQALMARVPPGALMQRAAAGLAAVCAGLVPRVYGSRVVVLAGSGDNGGDGLYAAARLARRGARVLAVAAGTRVHEAGATALRAAGGRVTGPGDPDLAAAMNAADLVLDGLLGIGGRGGLREPQAGLAALAEAARTGNGARVVAVDLPSGVDADTGEVTGAAVRADVTVTFGTWKTGLLVDPGADHAGLAQLVDIGLT